MTYTLDDFIAWGLTDSPVTIIRPFPWPIKIAAYPLYIFVKYILRKELPNAENKKD